MSGGRGIEGQLGSNVDILCLLFYTDPHIPCLLNLLYDADIFWVLELGSGWKSILSC